MTPERIAEIEAITTPTPFVRTICHGPTSWAKYYSDEVHELCRLARLGLRVEGAPTTRAKDTPTAWRGPTWLAYEPLPNGWGGKRVALVVLEDSE